MRPEIFTVPVVVTLKMRKGALLRLRATVKFAGPGPLILTGTLKIRQDAVQRNGARDGTSNTIAPVVPSIHQLNGCAQCAMTRSVIANIAGSHVNTVTSAIDEDKNSCCRSLGFRSNAAVKHKRRGEEQSYSDQKPK